MNKGKFLEKYRELLPSAYEWAKDEAKLDRYMSSVANTIRDENTKTWNASGNTLRAAWKAIGMTGNPTLKGLRALPD